MATVPQPIETALDNLLDDRANLDTLYGAKSASDTALAAATNNQATATSALAGGIATFNSDQQALITLIQTTLTSGAPSPQPPSPPVSPVSPPTT